MNHFFYLIFWNITSFCQFEKISQISIFFFLYIYFRILSRGNNSWQFKYLMYNYFSNFLNNLISFNENNFFTKLHFCWKEEHDSKLEFLLPAISLSLSYLNYLFLVFCNNDKYKFYCELPSQNLLYWRQQQKQQNNVWNLVRVNK